MHACAYIVDLDGRNLPWHRAWQFTPPEVYVRRFVLSIIVGVRTFWAGNVVDVSVHLAPSPRMLPLTVEDARNQLIADGYDPDFIKHVLQNAPDMFVLAVADLAWQVINRNVSPHALEAILQLDTLGKGVGGDFDRTPLLRTKIAHLNDLDIHPSGIAVNSLHSLNTTLTCVLDVMAAVQTESPARA